MYIANATFYKTLKKLNRTPLTWHGKETTTDPSLFLFHFNLFTNVIAIASTDSICLHRVVHGQRVTRTQHRIQFLCTVRGIEIHLMCLFILLQNNNFYVCDTNTLKCQVLARNVYSFQIQPQSQQVPHTKQISVFVRNKGCKFQKLLSMNMNCLSKSFKIERERHRNKMCTRIDDVVTILGKYQLFENGSVSWNNQMVFESGVTKLRAVSPNRVYALVDNKVFLIRHGRKYKLNTLNPNEDIVIRQHESIVLSKQHGEYIFFFNNKL
jgi:hypothetical protein